MGQNRRRVVLIALLSVAFATPSRAESIQTAGDQIVIGIVVVSAAVAVGITFLILHQKHKVSEITGCVTTGVNGMSVVDDKNKRIYALTGDPVGIKPGDQMTLEGKRRAESGKMPVFEARSVIKDLGVCH
jgi:hypothetical protein